MAKLIPMEVRASQEYGFNLGIKLIRGAYMNHQDMLFVASHNTDSVELAMQLTEEYSLKERVRFGQLKGFSDQVTANIAARGFEVFKYVPFGPTE